MSTVLISTFYCDPHAESRKKNQRVREIDCIIIDYNYIDRELESNYYREN